MEKNRLGISIGHGIGNGSSLSLDSELRLVKLALLYGDSITLHSPKSEMLMIAHNTMTQRPNRNSIERLARIVGTEQRASFYEFADGLDKLEEAFEKIKEFPRAQRKQQQRKMEKELEKEFRKFTVSCMEALRPTKIIEFQKLIKRGILSIEQYESYMESENFAEKFTEGIFDVVANQNNFPLLDSEMAKIINLYIKEERGKVSKVRQARAAQVQLSAEFIGRLPHFEQATIDEILDVRNTLRKPLTKFRAAMIEFSKTIQNASWDEDFTFEAEEIYHSKIAPTILEIEEAVSFNRIAQNLYQKSLINSAAAGTLTIAISNWLMPENIDKSIANLTSAALGLTTVAINERIQDIKRAEQNQMYFLYKANRMLSK